MSNKAPKKQRARVIQGEEVYTIETGPSSFHLAAHEADLGGRPLINVLDSEEPNSVATKRYVDRMCENRSSSSSGSASSHSCGSNCCCCEGPQGKQGPQGPRGSQGLQGDHGAQGPQGRRGCTGPKGDRGEQGCGGNRGCRGHQGFQGPQGEIGPQSDVEGPQGPQGPRGHKGCDGNDGCRGKRGCRGFQGVQGVQGNMGVQGWQGPQGGIGFQGVQGPQGFQGFQGIVGSQGVQGTGAQGFQGFQGVQGPQGFQGDFGPQGVMGPQGVNDTDGEEDVAIAAAVNLDPTSSQLQLTWDLSPTGFLQVGIAGTPTSISPPGDPTTTSISFALPPAILGSYDGAQKTGSGTIVATTGIAPRNMGALTTILCTSNVVTVTFMMQQDMPVFAPGGGTVYSVNVLLQFVPGP